MVSLFFKNFWSLFDCYNSKYDNNNNNDNNIVNHIVKIINNILQFRYNKNNFFANKHIEIIIHVLPYTIFTEDCSYPETIDDKISLIRIH